MASSKTNEQQQKNEAYELGAEHARNAASWIIDGNTKVEFIPAVLQMMEDGDPAADDYLPAQPNLSGEWADDLTPYSLFERIMGRDSTEEEFGLVEDMSIAYECGVSDTFQAECERILRAALS